VVCWRANPQGTLLFGLCGLFRRGTVEAVCKNGNDVANPHDWRGQPVIMSVNVTGGAGALLARILNCLPRMKGADQCNG
jgi:hypothetical protein